MEEQVTGVLEDHILDELSEYAPYVHASNSNSTYIHFEGLPNALTHKLRISNHSEKAKYGYKWQLRLDGVPPESERKKFCKYFKDPDALIKAFKTYYDKVEKGSPTGPVGSNVWD